ncbi:MAG TPA: ADOP family duplicated permease [Gemmatimonadales bacterium]|jgi:predicted permease
MWNPMKIVRRLNRTEQDFSAEVQAHLAIEADRLITDGWSPVAAAAEARRRFGNVMRAEERYHDARHVSWVEDTVRDVGYAVRTLAKDKVYVLAAVSALGVGLAANIALFSLFSAVALRPLPVPAPERLMSLYQVKPTAPYGTFSLADYFFYRDNNHAFSSVAADQPSHLRLAGIVPRASTALAPATPGAVAEPVVALFITANYFETFGIRPTLGRGLVREDESAAGTYAALISDNYWERRFSRDTSIIGATLLVSGIRATIVGVTPRDFAGVRPEVPDLWVTLAALGNLQERAARETAACCEMVGRLAPGASGSQARGELASLAAVRRKSLPAASQQINVTARPAISFGVLGTVVRPLFVALQVAMVLVLLIACANVAGLLLGRAAAREREIAVRLAIGASRARLVRQLVTEGVVVALVSGIVAASVTVYGLGVAGHLGAAFLSRQGGGSVPLAIGADGRVLLYVAAISVLAGIVFALAPAMQASRPDLVWALRSSTGSSQGHGMRGWLVATQVAVSVTLLITAAGLSRSATAVLRSDPGFRSGSVLTVWLTNPEELAMPASQAREIEREVREGLAATPGVQYVSVASRLPLGGNVSTSAMLPAERLSDDASRGAARQYPYAFVSQDYFAALGIPLIRGRTFSAEEVRDSTHVAMVSDSLARQFWPHDDPIGKSIAIGVAPQTGFNLGPAPALTAEVIGVVRDVHGLTATEPDAGDVYLPRLTSGWSSRIVLRVGGDMGRIQAAVPKVVHDIEPALPVSVQTMDDVVASDASVITARVGAGVLAVIGVLGLLLAAVGVYGMVSYTVRQQRRETGIRMALGARAPQILAANLRGSARWILGGVAVGTVLGAIGIVLSNTVLAAALVSASALDPAVLAGVPALIAALALFAAFLSGRKAALLDPAMVLRMDT